MNIDEAYRRIIHTDGWQEAKPEEVWKAGYWNGYEVFAVFMDGQGSIWYFLSNKKVFRACTRDEMKPIMLAISFSK